MYCKKNGCLLLVLGMLAASLNGQGLDDGFYNSSQSAAAFDVYLDRADLESDPRRWQSIARFGLDAVTAKWERDSILLADIDGNSGVNNDGAAKTPAEQSGVSGFVPVFRERLKAVLEERFREWLFQRFEDKKTPGELKPLLHAVNQANDRYLYQREGDGYVYDAAGDPITKKTIGAEEDAAAWRTDVGSVVDELIESGSEAFKTPPAELLDLLSKQSNEGAVRPEDYVLLLKDYKTSKKREFLALLTAEEARFTSKRVNDQFSLKKKEEESGADAFTENLLSILGRENRKGLEELKRGLDPHAASGAVENISVDPNHWMRTFRTDFNRGMDRWKEAEEALLRERVEWERRAGENFIETEKAWAKAYKKLEDERRSWEREIDILLRTGRDTWSKEEAALTNAIEEARAELERAVQERTSSFAYRTETFINMYIQSKQTMETAKKSGQYWLSRLASPAGITGEFGSAEFNRTIENLTEEDKENDGVKELLFWTELYNRYKEYSRTADAGLRESYGLALFNGAESVPYGSIASENVWEDYCLDDYQTELVRAAMLQDYWDRKVKIAEAVHEYAFDTSSERMTEAETTADYAAKRNRFLLEKEKYEKAVSNLKKTGDSLSTVRDTLAAAKADFNEKKRSLEAARDEYNRALDLFITENAGLFRNKIGAYYKRLVELHGSEGLPKIRDSLFSASRIYQDESSIEIAYSELAFLVNGAAESLHDLREAASKADDWVFSENGENFTEDLEDYLGVSKGDGYFEQFGSYFGSYRHAYENDDAVQTRYWRGLIESLAADIQRKKTLEYEKRKEEIRFLISKDMETWASSVIDTEVQIPEDPCGMEQWYTFFQSIAEAERLGYEKDIINTELKALRLIRDALETEDVPRAAEISSSYKEGLLRNIEGNDPDSGEVTECMLAFSAIISDTGHSVDGGDAGGPAWDIDFVTAGIEACTIALRKNPASYRQLFRTPEGGGLTGFLKPDGRYSVKFKENLCGLVDRYYPTAPHTMKESAENGRFQILRLLEDYDCISFNDSNVPALERPELLWNDFTADLNSLESLETRFADFSLNLIESAKGLPEYLVSDLLTYIQGLQTYLCFKMVGEGTKRHETEELDRRIGSFQKWEEYLFSISEEIAKTDDYSIGLAGYYHAITSPQDCGLQEDVLSGKLKEHRQETESALVDYSASKLALLMCNNVKTVKEFTDLTGEEWEETARDLLPSMLQETPEFPGLVDAVVQRSLNISGLTLSALGNADAAFIGIDTFQNALETSAEYSSRTAALTLDRLGKTAGLELTGLRRERVRIQNILSFRKKINEIITAKEKERGIYRSFLHGDFCGEGTGRMIEADVEPSPLPMDGYMEGEGKDEYAFAYFPGESRGRGPWEENSYLEAVNTYINGGNSFLEALEATVKYEKENRAASRIEFYKVFSDFDNTVSYFADNERRQAEEEFFMMRPETNEKYVTAVKLLVQAQSEIEFLKNEIAGVGSTLESYYRDKGRMMKVVVKPLEQKVTELETKYKASREVWITRSREFETANNKYQAASDQVREADRGFRSAQFEFRKSEAVLEYASSPYLGTKRVEERLAYAVNKYNAVKDIYDSLSEMYYGKGPEKFISSREGKEYKDAYSGYSEHLHNNLSLEQLTGLLLEAKAEQELRVERAKEQTVLEMEKIMVYTGGKSGDGKLDMYLENPACVTWFDQVSKTADKDGEQMFARWGRAFWHIQYGALGDNEVRQFAAGALRDQWAFVDRKNINVIGYIRNLGGNGYNGMSKTEKENLSIYLGLTGLAGHENSDAFSDFTAGATDFLTQQMTLDLNRNVSEHCLEVRDVSLQGEEKMLVAAGAAYALGVLFSWFPPVAVPAFAAASVFGITAAVLHSKADQYGAVGDYTGELASNIENRIQMDTNVLLAAFSSYRKQKEILVEEQEKLEKLLAEKEDGELLQTGEFIESLLLAGEIKNTDLGKYISTPEGTSELSGIRLKNTLRRLVKESGYIRDLVSEDRSNSVAMVEGLKRQAEERKTEALSKLNTCAEELNNLQAAAVKEYRGVFFEELEGIDFKKGLSGEGTDKLKRSMERAFRPPSYRTAEHMERMINLSQAVRSNVAGKLGERIEQECIHMEGQNLRRLFEERMKGLVNVKELEWAQLSDDFDYRRGSWEEMIASLMERGRSEWRAGLARLDQERRGWLQRYSREFESRKKLWESKYEDLAVRKNKWIRESVRKISQASAEKTSGLSRSAETACRRSESIIIPELKSAKRGPEQVVSRILKGGTFSELLDKAERCNNSVESIHTGAYAAFGKDISMDEVYFSAVSDYSKEDRRQIEEHITAILSNEARRNIPEMLEGLQRAVEDANESQDEMFDRMAFGENFRRDGEHYTREALVDDTVTTGRQYETQTVGVYNYYLLPPVDLKTDLSRKILDRLTSDGVEAQIKRAFSEVEGIRETIFGDPKRSSSVGDFGEHVGTPAESVAPEEIDYEADDMTVNIKDPGTNESGRITKAVIIYNILQGRGWSEFNKPVYEKRMWDDDGRVLTAPTIRGLVDIGASVLIGALAPGAGFLLNQIDDALFSALDYTGGYADGGSALLNIGKNMATAAATAGIGAGFDKLGSLFGNNFGADIILSGARSVSTTIAAGGISAVHLDPAGRLGFDAGRFSESVAGNDALAAYASSLVSATVRSGLSGNLEGLERTPMAKKINTVSGLGASAAALGIRYGINGAASVNLVNTGDIAGLFGGDIAANRIGLLELTFSGSESPVLEIGAGGTDVSGSRLYQAGEGFSAWIGQQRIRGYDLFNPPDYAAGYSGYRKAGTALRSLWAFGDGEARGLVQRILSGKDRLRIGYAAAGAHTKLIGGRGAGTRIIDLATLGNDVSKESRLRAGIVLQHEAWRDGVVSSADLQFAETFGAVKAHTEMALRMAGAYGETILNGNADLRRDILAYRRGLPSLITHTGRTYDYSADFWKLLKDGSLEYDGSGYLYDEAGNVIRDENGDVVGAGGIEGGLLAILGWEDTVENRGSVIDLILSGNMTYGVKTGDDPADPANWYWNLGTHNLSNMGKRVQAPDHILHYLPAYNHFEVLRNRNKTDLTYSGWTLGNAKSTIREEVLRIEEDLRRNGYSNRQAKRFAAAFQNAFSNIRKAGDAFDLLETLNTFSEGNSGKYPVIDHASVLFGDRIFRGAGGDMGLAEALRAAYNARELDNYQGRAIQDIAEAFTKMNIHYGGGDATGTEPGGVFRGNYPGMFKNLRYGDRVDFRRDGLYGSEPALDCTGYTGLVYHAAGYLSNGMNLNEGPYRFDGVRNTFAHERIEVRNVPEVGDLIGMDGHVGILGKDEKGNMIIYHSAPDPAYTPWSDLGRKKSGPRTDLLYTFSDGGPPVPSKYMQRLVDADLFSAFVKDFGGQYGRWREDYDIQSSFTDEDVQRFYDLFSSGD